MTQRTLVLDLDGTLVDSVPDLAAALNRVIASRRLPGFTRLEVAGLVGDGAEALVKRAFAARGVAADETALNDFLADYGAHAAHETRPYPEAGATLATLVGRGWRLAVCTNKPIGPARSLLAALGLSPWLAAVGGGDSYAVRKPHPGHLLATLAEAGADPAASIMVGDHHNDIVAAAGCCMPAIFAAWGYGPRGAGDGAAATAERFADLPDIAERLMPAR